MLLILSIYSAVELNPMLLSHFLASGYFCSGLSPVTINASVHRSLLPSSAILRTFSGSNIDTSVSVGSFLYVQYEHLSLQRFTRFMKTFREYVIGPGLQRRRIVRQRGLTQWAYKFIV